MTKLPFPIDPAKIEPIAENVVYGPSHWFITPEEETAALEWYAEQRKKESDEYAQHQPTPPQGDHP